MIKKYDIEKVALWRKMIFLRFSSVVEQKHSAKKKIHEVCDSQTLYSIRGATCMVIFNQIDRHLHVHVRK